MIKVIIIDDEPLARSVVKEYLSTYTTIEIAQECNDGFEGVKAIAQHRPDLIFLDVQMPRITGFEMLELLETPPAVIFTTAYDEYAIKAFEAQATDYLLKPFSKERFDKALQKCFTHFNKYEEKNYSENRNEIPAEHPETKNRIVVKSGNSIKIIPVRDVVYIEAYDDYVKIFTSDDMFLKKKTMSFYENILDTKQFVRLHRSYIANIAFISGIEPMEKDNHLVKLKNNISIPASRAGYKKLRDLLEA